MKIKIGARGSTLSVVQTELVVRALKANIPNLEPEVVAIRTSGDSKQGTPAAANGDKKDWIYEIEVALLNREIDIAIHSAKDVPINIEAGTELVPVLERENSHDLFVGRISPEHGRRIRLAELSNSATIGVSSLRRRAQMLILRPDLRIADLRGNVPTRLAKLDQSSTLHGTVLAAAGLLRLGHRISDYELLNTEIMLPAVNQGVIVSQCRGDRPEIHELLQKIIHRETQAEWIAERACIAELGADCHSAVGVMAKVTGSTLQIVAKVFSHDGREVLTAKGSGSDNDSQKIGIEAAKDLLDLGAAELLCIK